MSDSERILVCVSASPTNADVIYRAAALSRAMGAELIAVNVESAQAQDAIQAQAVHDHLSLAERHGALLTTIYGDDPATAIARYAQVSGITKIVLGRSPRRRNPFARRETLMARLNELAPNVDIVQVLINLVNNAVKYTPEGARITIGAGRAGDMARVWVEDDGPGIPEDAGSRVFDMFYTGDKRSADSQRGIGLGLALCKSIVQAHGGEIGVEAVRPHGARFWFTLPIAEVHEDEP